MPDQDRSTAAERLAPLIGSWTVEAIFPEGGPAPEEIVGRAEIEPILDGQCVMARTLVEDPVPDSTAIFSAHPDSGTFTQHYFDSRGVIRLYTMTFAAPNWTLHRVSPDFSSLDFSQRFLATLASDGNSIRGAWEASDDGLDWRLDFEVVYTRAG